ncbi:MAG: alpha/beta hydrolase [Myxococcales bacterium]|nr:alpha/beta hydrolase [Myxococcales bacterium]
MARTLRVDPAFYDLEFEPLTLRARDGVSLDAWFVPARGAARGAVLMHHHYGGQKAAMLPWIELFVDAGLDALAFDGRGHAGSPCSAEQDGYEARFGDVHAAAEALRARGARQIFGYGQSQGAAVVIGALAAERAAGARDIAGVIVDSGPAPLAGPSLYWLARTLFDDALPRPERALATLFATATLYRRTGPGLYALTLWRALVGLRQTPLLWLHGDSDVVIPHAAARVWFEACAPLSRGRWHKLLVEGAAHVECLQTDEARVAAAVHQLLAACAACP